MPTPTPHEGKIFGMTPTELRCLLLVVLNAKFTLDAELDLRVMNALGYKSTASARAQLNRALRHLRDNESALSTSVTKKDTRKTNCHDDKREDERDNDNDPDDRDGDSDDAEGDDTVSDVDDSSDDNEDDDEEEVA